MLRRIPDPQSFKTVNNRYSTWIVFFIEKTKDEYIDTLRDMYFGEIMAKENTWDYLDLASTPSILCQLRIGSKLLSQITREMPQECKEFFIAEKKYWISGMFGILYSTIIGLYLECFASFQEDFAMFYQAFEDVFFQRIELVSDRVLRMKEIRRFLNVYKRCKPRRVHVFEFVLELCTNPPLSCELTMEVLETFFRSKSHRNFIFDLVSDARSLEVMLCHAKQMEFDFWGLWQGTGDMSDSMNAVVDCISSDYRNSFARVLLRYGFRYSSQVMVRRRQFYMFLSYSYQDLIIGEQDGLSRMLETKNGLRMMLIVDTFNTFVDPDGYEDIPDKILTLICLTRTLSEPYVTPKELYNKLQANVVPAFRDNLRRICDEYEEADVFDEDYTILQPRCLMHLCRCKIRDTLRDKMMLPEGIGQWDLPKYIKMYLELRF